MKSQLAQVKEILLEDKKISRNHCLRNFITTRLAAYIGDLKKEGFKISKEMVKTENGTDCVYTLEDAPIKVEYLYSEGELVGKRYVNAG